MVPGCLIKFLLKTVFYRYEMEILAMKGLVGKVEIKHHVVENKKQNNSFDVQNNPQTIISNGVPNL